MANRHLLQKLVKDAIELIGSYGSITGNLQSRFENMIETMIPDHPYANTFHLLPKLYNLMVPEASDEQRQKANTLGMIFSMASHVMFDDLVDKDEVRFGQPTWSKLNNHQVSQVGFDYVMFDSVVYHLLEKHFGKSTSTFCRLVHCFQRARMECCIASMLEVEFMDKFCNNATESQAANDFSMQECERINTMKMGIHVKLVVIGAMTLAGVEENGEKRTFEKAELIAEKIGLWAQTHDDYYDVFSKHANNDALNTDIRRGQFSFLFAAAKDLCKSKEDWQQVLAHYGKDCDDSVNWVKTWFVEVGVIEKFKEYRKQLSEETFEKIEIDLGIETGVGQALHWFFTWFNNITSVDEHGN